MNNAKKISSMGRWVMVVGSMLYAVELLIFENKLLTYSITAIYVVALVMMLIGKIGARKEHAEETAK